MKITQELLAASISISWEIAHDSDSADAWRYRWNRTANELYGMSLLLAAAANSQEILDDCRLLVEIAASHSINNPMKMAA